MLASAELLQNVHFGSRGGPGTPETQQSKKIISQNLTQFSRASVQQPALPNIRGNVSVLQLRSTSEPWETKSSVYSGGRETHQISHQTSRESNASSRERGLRREGLSVEEDCSRELSPVRWCDQEVDGVYLGRSGWVQVQQRSLDENRASANGYQHVKHGNHVTRIKMADYHCSRSEPGKLPPERPGYLPLRREGTPRSLDLGAIEPSSPPPATPIISPPPAFQDVSHRPRPYLRHQPALSRSDAIEISPPESPTYRYQPPRPSPAYAQPSRVKKKTPSPVHTPHHFVPQTKSLEDTIASRRAIYQKHDSSSSSSGSFGFRSLDTGSTLPMPLRGMPRLSETDSSLCGYDEDEDRNFLAVADARVSPRGRAMQRTNRRSPASPQPPARSPSSSSSSSCSRSPTFRRQQPRQDANRVSSRVRRSRSLQLPERKSPQQISPQDTRQPSPNYVEKPLTKNIMVEPQSRLSKDHSRQSSLQSNPEPSTRGTRILEQLTRQAKLIEQINRQSRNNSLEQQTLPNRTKSHNSDPRKRHPPSHSRSMGSNDYDLEAELRREAEVEARLVADYLGSARSREAARELLRHRYLDLREEPGSGMRPQSSDYNVVLVGTGRRLARGASSPCQPNPCNPTTCDFWPHCAHRDVYPQQHPHAQPSGLKPSQSYPTQHAQPRKEAVPRSSPASLERNRKRSPVISVESPGGSSSSSSDVWVGAGSLRGSPRPESRSRPGSAPTEQQSVVRPQAQQRSLSLPKWFQPTRDQHQTLPSSHRPPRPSMQQTSGSGWSRSAGGRPPPRSMVAGSTLRPPTPEISRTAPTTPVREMKTQEKQQTEVLSQQSSRFSSTPALEPTSNTEWYIKDWVTYSDDKENLLVNKEIPVSHKNIPGESVLQKFRKSFSLKFHKKGQIKDCEEEESSGGAVSLADSPPSSPQPRSHLDHDKEKFRFGPLVWRSSKERKKGKKAARSAKCNSGDSGIQIEMSSKIPGDSSESHDTDHLGDEETLDDLDSPPVVRRRGTGSSSEGKPSRPTSDVINQVLIDKLKADLQACRGLRRANVRRTHSDLGGQRLYNWDPRRSYRRLYSSPSPIKSRVMSSSTTNDPARTNLTEAQIRHLKRMRGRPTRLRRSVSQPLGINELSPLVRRKPSSGIRQNVFSEDERGGATTDDEMHSDSESSVTSLTERKKSFEMAMDEDVVILAEAVWDHVAMEKEELGFRAGDVIEVLDTLDKDWWWGTCNNSYGWFPSPFVRLRVSQQETVEDCLAAVAEGRPKSLRRRQSVSLLSNDQVRSKVVTELLNTERDFVKILRDVTEGYLVECRKRKDMFSEEQIQSIFSNLEDLLDFQDKFLQDLETRIDWEAPHRSCVAQSFINYKSGFRMYSEYCNSQPMAIATLQELYQHVSFSKFFEACRLMRGLIEIPLDGYLLTPVQRICKYPLQLAELLKYTKTEHADHEKLVEAHEAMRDVAVLINERKRRMESLEKLAAWQLRLDGWEGEDLIESSSQLIHQGDAIRVTTGMWTNNITLFLFDHQLIYCKKDILKRNTYVYKGRMSMDTSEVINLSDGKEPVLGVTVRHGIKVYSCVRDKWLVFCLRTAEEKSTWLQALARERCLVEDDMREGIEFAPADRQLAKLAAIRHSTYTPPIPGKSYKLSESAMRSRSLQRGSTLQQQPQPESTQSLGRRVGTWFNFGGNKKWRSGSSGSAIRSATLHAVHPT